MATFPKNRRWGRWQRLRLLGRREEHLATNGTCSVVVRLLPNTVILPSLVLVAVMRVVLAYTTSRLQLLITTVLHGIGYGGVQSTLLTLAVDRASSRARGVALATVMGAMDVGIGVS